VTLLPFGFATGFDKTHWHGCTQEGISDVATILARGIVAGGWKTHCNCCAQGNF